MKIGQALKEERQKLGLTQEQMIKGIINKGHYSKIERGLESISIDTLFRIILKHHIDISDFFNKVKYDYYTSEDKKAEELKQKMLHAFNNNQREKVGIYLNEILDLKEHQLFKYRTIISIASLENSLSDLSLAFKNKIVTRFSEHENWVENIGALQLFSDCMKIFSLEQVDYFLGQLLKHYQKNSCSESMRERVAIICNNYLCYCYKQKLNGDNIGAALDYLASLETTTHFLLYRICHELYFNLFSGNTEKATQIKKLLMKCGYKDCMEYWQI